MQVTPTPFTPFQQKYHVNLDMNLSEIDSKITEVKNLLLSIPPLNEAITQSAEKNPPYVYKSTEHQVLHKYHQTGFFSSKPTNVRRAPEGVYLTKELAPLVEKQLDTMQQIRNSKLQISEKLPVDALSSELKKIDEKIASLEVLKSLSTKMSPKDSITQTTANGKEATFKTDGHKELYRQYRKAFENKPLGAKPGQYNVGRYLSAASLTKTIEFDLKDLETQKEKITAAISAKK